MTELSRRAKYRHHDWHHIRHGGWRLSCDTAYRVGPIRREPIDALRDLLRRPALLRR